VNHRARHPRQLSLPAPPLLPPDTMQFQIVVSNVL
jgi:hypothetical protein